MEHHNDDRNHALPRFWLIHNSFYSQNSGLTHSCAGWVFARPAGPHFLDKYFAEAKSSSIFAPTFSGPWRPATKLKNSVKNGWLSRISGNRSCFHFGTHGEMGEWLKPAVC